MASTASASDSEAPLDTLAALAPALSFPRGDGEISEIALRPRGDVGGDAILCSRLARLDDDDDDDDDADADAADEGGDWAPCPRLWL